MVVKVARTLRVDQGFRGYIRFYGFEVGELTTPILANLDLGRDPKLAWALRRLQVFPVNLNRAPRERLLRVPGLGARNVDRILKIRRWHSLRIADLVKLRLSVPKFLPFVETADHAPKIVGGEMPAQQLDLFGPENPAR